MKKTVWLDMDGTIANLYGQIGWLENIKNENTTPFENAELMVEEKTLEKIAKNYNIGIITWTPKNATKEYNKRVRKAKIEWLEKNLPNTRFYKIHCVKYGTPKYRFMENENDILYDDEKQNLETWRGEARNAKMLH